MDFHSRGVKNSCLTSFSIVIVSITFVNVFSVAIFVNYTSVFFLTKPLISPEKMLELVLKS